MKKEYFKVFLILLIGSLLLPGMVLGDRLPAAPGKTDSTPAAPSGETFLVRRTETGEVETLSREDYLLGVLAAEIDPECHSEAIKAQAVAAYSFALYRKSENEKEPYDLTDSPAADQAFFSLEELQSRWGDAYETNVALFRAAIAAVSGQALYYDGAPALTVYHNISSGKTESAEQMWGGSYPYLTVVESVGDVLSPDYLSTSRFSASDFSERLKNDLSLSVGGDPEDWLGKAECTPSGTVQTLTLCGKKISGGEIRTVFGLASQCFDLDYEDDTFTFTVRGSGHNVGMSQYGANYMASLGSGYAEILAWYYPGTELKTLG